MKGFSNITPLHYRKYEFRIIGKLPFTRIRMWLDMRHNLMFND